MAAITGRPVSTPLLAAIVALLSLPGARGTAQTIGSLAAERARLAEITGDTSVARGAAAPLALSLVGIRLSPLRPSALLVWNSAIPYSLNDGALWAGRGVNASVTAGFEASRRLGAATLRLAVAPALYHSQNKPFQVMANRTVDRSGWANPFHGPEASLDLPHRFGDRSLFAFDLGNSSVEAQWSRVAVGATTASAWWGPGIRNAIVLSNNAGGIPRFFLRTARPLRSRIGGIEAEWIAGTLTQSRFFSTTTPDYRTLSGLRVQLTPAIDSGLTMGLTRVVYSPATSSPVVRALEHADDVLTRWENVAPVQRSDQIASLFARWIFPPTGLEVYGEWARMDLPHYATELLTAAHYSGGWTFGFQWAQPRRNSAYLRLQSEFTYLEQSVVFPDRVTPDFYSGRASPQGYTQRGQVIGAAIGPGSSSQFVALDWIAPGWQVGVYANRIRWDNDAMYRELGTTFFHHDVSLMPGLRGAWRTRFSDFTADLGIAHRYNYLFQNGDYSPPGFRTVDIRNVTLALAATPR